MGRYRIKDVHTFKKGLRYKQTFRNALRNNYIERMDALEKEKKEMANILDRLVVSISRLTTYLSMREDYVVSKIKRHIEKEIKKSIE